MEDKYIFGSSSYEPCCITNFKTNEIVSTLFDFWNDQNLYLRNRKRCVGNVNYFYFDENGKY